jgi:hypothetical protein
MSVKKINSMLKSGLKKVIIESEISDPNHIAKMVIGDVSHQSGSLVKNVGEIDGGATGTFGIEEMGDDGNKRDKGVMLKVIVGENNIEADIYNMSGTLLDSVTGLREMEDYESLITSITKSIQRLGITK